MTERKGESTPWNERLDRLVGKENRLTIEVPYAKVVIERSNLDGADWVIKITDTDLGCGWSEIEYEMREGEGLVGFRARPKISDRVPGLGLRFSEVLDRGKVHGEITLDNLGEAQIDKFREQAESVIEFIELAERAEGTNASSKVA